MDREDGQQPGVVHLLEIEPGFRNHGAHARIDDELLAGALRDLVDEIGHLDAVVSDALEAAAHGAQLAPRQTPGRAEPAPRPAPTDDTFSFPSSPLISRDCQRRRGGGGAKPSVDSSQNRFFSPHSSRCLRHSVSRHSYLMKWRLSAFDARRTPPARRDRRADRHSPYRPIHRGEPRMSRRARGSGAPANRRCARARHTAGTPGAAEPPRHTPRRR